MTDTGIRFKHSTPEQYDRYMGPLLFEPYAKAVAERAALLQPDAVGGACAVDENDAPLSAHVEPVPEIIPDTQPSLGKHDEPSERLASV